jgi:hypothetical protein
MLACTAATPGSGKSYMGRVVGRFLTGRDVPVSEVGAGSIGELDKRLVACLLSGAPVVHLDNCNGRLDSELLCQILTERTATVRPLGLSQQVIISGMPMILANGNNVQVDENLSRRTLLVPLDAGLERPELRNFEQRPDRAVLERRNEFVAAALTALRAFLQSWRSGQAQPIRPSLGSFEGWSDHVRSALVWYGYRDPVEAMAFAQAEDPDKAARIAVFHCLHELFGGKPFTANDVVSRMSNASYDALEEKPEENALCEVLATNTKSLLPSQKQRNRRSALRLSVPCSRAGLRRLRVG